MRLGEVIRYWRCYENIGVRECAKDIGISTATLSRIENGYQCDAKTLMKILVWITAP